MKLSVLTSHAVLPVADPVEIVALVTLESERAGAAQTPVDLRFVLDRSGSMTEPSGVGKHSKLEALKRAVAAAVDLLAPGEDQVSCVAFDDQTTRVLTTHVVASDVDRAQVKRDVASLRTGGSTRPAGALRHAVSVASARANAARRVVLFTDGQVDDAGEAAACRAAADEARERRVPLAVFAVGRSYDEALLRELADRAGQGSFYAHVGRVDDVRAALAEEIAHLRAAEERDVEVAFRAGPGASLLEVTRLWPQQVELANGANPREATDALAVLDDRGQRYLLRCRLAGGREGVHAIAAAEVRYAQGGRRERRDAEVFVELSSDAARWSSANGVVLATVVNAAGVRAVTQGKLGLAQTLFGQSGNAGMLQKLTVLGSAAAAAPDGEAGRSLRTVVAQGAHLATLGSAPPRKEDES